MAYLDQPMPEVIDVAEKQICYYDLRGKKYKFHANGIMKENSDEVLYYWVPGLTFNVKAWSHVNSSNKTRLEFSYMVEYDCKPSELNKIRKDALNAAKEKKKEEGKKKEEEKKKKEEENSRKRKRDDSLEKIDENEKFLLRGVKTCLKKNGRCVDDKVVIAMFRNPSFKDWTAQQILERVCQEILKMKN
eukprot:TRINITY_DN205_c0_g1_i2.p1 TRINITY_DN205_c0_g1~~TRINITY_DN205_c0_g1_i2.p1  ORF type:complete len:189 (+),score=43.62 TRINITY_DN205_c0_g1_i2:63-629(+)